MIKVIQYVHKHSKEREWRILDTCASEVASYTPRSTEVSGYRPCNVSTYNNEWWVVWEEFDDWKSVFEWVLNQEK